MVYPADYLRMKMKPQPYTAKLDCRRYRKKHRRVTAHLMDHRNMALMMQVVVVLAHLTVPLPSQHSPATPWRRPSYREMRNSLFLMICLRRYQKAVFLFELMPFLQQLIDLDKIVSTAVHRCLE